MSHPRRTPAQSLPAKGTVDRSLQSLRGQERRAEVGRRSAHWQVRAWCSGCPLGGGSRTTAPANGKGFAIFLIS